MMGWTGPDGPAPFSMARQISEGSFCRLLTCGPPLAFGPETLEASARGVWREDAAIVVPLSLVGSRLCHVSALGHLVSFASSCEGSTLFPPSLEDRRPFECEADELLEARRSTLSPSGSQDDHETHSRRHSGTSASIRRVSRYTPSRFRYDSHDVDC